MEELEQAKIKVMMRTATSYEEKLCKSRARIDGEKHILENKYIR